MKLATTTGDFSRYTSSQLEIMEYIRRAGFKYLDYNFGIDYQGRTGAFSADWREYIQTVQKQAERLGVRFVQAHAPMGTPLAEGSETFIADNLRCMEVCAALGIKNLVVHSGYLPNISREECFARNKAFYQPLLERAEVLDMNILTENFNKMSKPDVFWVDNAEDLLALIEYVDHPRFHAVWDAGHGNLQEMPQQEALRILGDHVYALHVQDNMGERDQHFAPFFGTMNPDSLMQGLLEIGYQGYFTFEANLPPAVKRRPHEGEEPLRLPPIEVKQKGEELLYEIGKAILTAYNVYEE